MRDLELSLITCTRHLCREVADPEFQARVFGVDSVGECDGASGISEAHLCNGDSHMMPSVVCAQATSVTQRSNRGPP